MQKTSAKDFCAQRLKHVATTENTSDEIEAVVRRHPAGIPLRLIATEMAPPLPRRTLQYRIAKLVAAGRVVRQGAGRGAVYHPPRTVDLGFSAGPGRPV